MYQNKMVFSRFHPSVRTTCALLLAILFQRFPALVIPLLHLYHGTMIRKERRRGGGERREERGRERICRNSCCLFSIGSKRTEGEREREGARERGRRAMVSVKLVKSGGAKKGKEGKSKGGDAAARKAAKEADRGASQHHEECLEEARERVGKERVERAVSALVKHAYAHDEAVKKKKEKMDLFDQDDEDSQEGGGDSSEFVLVSFALKRVPLNLKKSFKLHRIQVSHPLQKCDKDSVDLCVFVKDKAEAEKWLDERNVKTVKKVISLKELRTGFQTFQQRRDLAASYDVFLADDRIINMLPKTLGRVFMNTNKRPLPLRLAQKGNITGDLGARIRRSVESAYLSLSGGSNYTMRAARWRWKDENQIVENIMDCIAAGVQKCPGKWKNIQALHIKTGKSVALPVYTSLPEDIQDKDEEGAVETKDKSTKKRPRPSDAAENEAKSRKGKASGLETGKTKSKTSSTPKKQSKSAGKAASSTSKKADSTTKAQKSTRKSKRQRV